MSMRGRNILIISDSEKNSDMLYASGFRAPDPFIFTIIKKKTYLLANPLELGRAQKESSADEVVNMSGIRTGRKKRSLADIFYSFARRFKVNTFEVPHEFPLYLGDRLRKKGIRLKAISPPFFPERMIKTEEEIKKIKTIIRVAEKAMKRAEDVLRNSMISSKGYIRYKGKNLTSEYLKRVINLTFAEHDGHAENTIAAGGDQACDPHCTGHGPLKAYEPIIMDIFPCSNDTGYHADITRTFIKGKPSKTQKNLYRAVKEAQRVAISMVKPRASAKNVHKAVSAYFRKKGYETVIKRGTMKGFIHSTGHGLGLDVHEPPRISDTSGHIFKKGDVITIEPGLYYPGTGGVRIEDDVVVTANGCEVLTRYHTRWVMP